MTPTEALEIAAALILAAMTAIEEGNATLPSDVFSAGAHTALNDLRAAIAARG